MNSRPGAITAERNGSLLAHLERGGTVLTSGRREARHLRRLYDAAQLAAGRRVWPTADVLPLAAWMAARWAELTACDPTLPTLLDPAQALWPWRAQVAGEALGSLLAPHDLAGAARSAWVALRRHAGTVEMLDGLAATQDQRRFQGWASQAEALLKSNGWLDPGLLELALAGQAHRLKAGRDLLLAGGRLRTPALDALLAGLARSGTAVRIAAPAEPDARGHCYAATDAEDELRTLTRWLRARLMRNPATSLAVFVADLQARREALQRALESGLQPELELPGGPEREQVFDLAGGPPLADLGIADAALSCLGAGMGRIDFQAASRLLLSRYVATGDDEADRTRLELRLRKAGVTNWPVAGLARVSRAASCPGFADAVTAAAECCAGARQRSVASWAQTFGAVLSIWRWPGDAALASDEYQAAEALRERLARFAGLARTAPALDFEAALAELTRLASGPFQPERGDPAVLVFDRLEAPDVSFDGLWVVGMGAAAWPRAAAPDPFVPVRVQQRLGMPGATGADCLEAALATTGAWLGSAPEVVFSWARRLDDATVEPSRVLPPLLEPLPEDNHVPPQAVALFAGGGLEALQDDPVPPLDPASASGGARIFELQSQCPFRAFGELRLGARPLEEPQAGVDARQRGSVLHRVLQLVWGDLGGSHGLQRDAAEVQALVERCIERALAERLPAGTARQLWELESDWQRAAVTRELELERGRGDFEVVAREDRLQTQLAGLPLQVVPDRADRLPDGSVLLIDYKTGEPGLGQWQGMRPERPQLPLYAVLYGEPVAAIAFAAVSARRARFIGVGRSSDLLPGLKGADAMRADGDPRASHDWPQVCSDWSAALLALAQAHLRGEAAVDPKGSASCRHCHLGTLCRVSGALPAEEAEDG